MVKKTKKTQQVSASGTLGLFGLAGIVVSSMIGGGIFLCHKIWLFQPVLAVY